MSFLKEPPVYSFPSLHLGHISEIQARQVLTDYTHRAICAENCHMAVVSGQLWEIR